MYINREMNEEMSEHMWERMQGEKLPRVRFFTPIPIFWEYMKEVQEQYGIEVFADCGTGNGDLPKEATNHKIKIAGVDIVRREGNEIMQVHIMPAHRMPFTFEFWPMACRPDHSGWVRGLLEKALQDDNSGFIYVGLRRNMAQDLGSHMLLKHSRYKNVGEENEDMLIFAPIGE